MRLIRLLPVLLMLCPAVLHGEDGPDVGTYLNGLSRLGAKRPFLSDSSDVFLEQRSLNRFFTEKIYHRLEGNAYFGYRYDEGFLLAGKDVSIDSFNDLTGGTGAAYRLALEQALASAKYQIRPDAICQIGICIVGIEAGKTDRTLPGVMVEAYLRNSSIKKSFFIRFGAGSPRGLAAAIRLSASMLVAELEARREHD